VIYVSLDPGGTTGYCMWDSREPSSFWTSQVGPEEHHLQLYSALEDDNPGVIICEAFQYRPNDNRPKVVLDSAEYVGVVKLWVQNTNAVAAQGPPCTLACTMVMQSASVGKAFWTNDKLKALDLYKASMPHGMDALRHMLYFLTFTGGNKTWINKLKTFTISGDRKDIVEKPRYQL
jgi:hypothetical protein